LRGRRNPIVAAAFNVTRTAARPRMTLFLSGENREKSPAQSAADDKANKSSRIRLWLRAGATSSIATHPVKYYNNIIRSRVTRTGAPLLNLHARMRGILSGKKGAMYLRHVIVHHCYFYVYYRHYAAAFRGITIEIRPPFASIDFACSSLVIKCKLCAKLPAGEILALNCHLMDKCSITCQMNLISPVGVANLTRYASECSDMDLNNKEYPQVEDFLARFNIYNIYTSYKRVPVHWTSVRRA